MLLLSELRNSLPLHEYKASGYQTSIHPKAISTSSGPYLILRYETTLNLDSTITLEVFTCGCFPRTPSSRFGKYVQISPRACAAYYRLSVIHKAVMGPC